MDRAVFVALSGSLIQERRLDTLTDNLANVNTPGFKKQSAVFKDAMPATSPHRHYATTDGVVNDMAQGTLENTGKSLDLAIRGNGFFAIETTSGTRYTRNGNFRVDSTKHLVTSDGNKVLGENGPIVVQSASVSIDAAGAVKDNGVAVDKLKLVDFNSYGDLTREGGSYAAAAAAGTKPAGANTQVEQGFLEISNVSVVRSMTALIEAMRAYEAHAKMIKTVDDMTRKSTEEVGRTA